MHLQDNPLFKIPLLGITEIGKPVQSCEGETSAMGIAQPSLVFQDLFRVCCSSEDNRLLHVISGISGQVEALCEQCLL